MPMFHRSLVASGAAALVVLGGTASVVTLNATSSDSAQLAASCDPNPAVTDTTDGGSRLTVSCTVPQTTVTVTAAPSSTAPTASPSESPSGTPTPSDTPTPSTTPTPSNTPTPSSTPSSSPTSSPTTTPASSGAVLGASLGQALPTPATLPAVRYYRAPAWKGSELEAAYKAGTRVFVVSTKDSTPASMVAMIQAAPADARFYVTSYHEPDDNIAAGTLTVATYVSRLNAMCKAVASFPNVKCGPIHNGFIGAATWRKDEAGLDWSLITFWGMDRYSPNYETAAQQFKEGADYAKSLGLPLVIGETGADPANAAAQKTFAAQARAWALDPANGADAVLWWEQTGYQFANADAEHAFLGN